jgi:hypothetical protein
MDSEPVSTWQRALEIQRFGRSAEHVPSADQQKQKQNIAKIAVKIIN